ncbi:MAG: hypothetical protein AABW83_04285 [Nanoarchaeota archaeon]
MSLFITRDINERFYGFPVNNILLGEYFMIQNCGPTSRSKTEIKLEIVAPKDIIILREEHLREYGGLEGTLRAAYNGSLNKSREINSRI